MRPADSRALLSGKRNAFMRQMSAFVEVHGPFSDSRLIYESDNTAVIEATRDDGSTIQIALVNFGPVQSLP